MDQVETAVGEIWLLRAMASDVFDIVTVDVLAELVARLIFEPFLEMVHHWEVFTAGAQRVERENPRPCC